MKRTEEYGKTYFFTIIKVGVASSIINILIFFISISAISALISLIVNLIAIWYLSVMLFADVNDMIKERLEQHSESVDESTNVESNNREVWSYKVISTDSDKKVVLLDDSSNEAVFEIQGDTVYPRSQNTAKEYGENWVEQAVEYIEREFDLN